MLLQFLAEFESIVENCKKYYEANHRRIDQVMRLKDKFDELVKKHLPDDSYFQLLEKGIPSDASSDEEEAQKGSGSESSSSDQDEEDSSMDKVSVATGSRIDRNGGDDQLNSSKESSQSQSTNKDWTD